MKVLKKIISLILLITIITQNTIFSLASNTDTEEIVANQTVNVENMSDARDINWKAWIAKALWYIAKAGSSAFYSSQPIKDETTQRVHLTTGAKTFNSGDIGSSCYIDIPVESSYPVNMDITLTASTDFVNSFFGKIAVVLRTPSGVEPIDGTLGHNGMTAYEIKSSGQLGTYRARFTTTNKEKWNCGIILYNYNATGTYAMLIDDNGKEKDIIINEDKQMYYIIPSDRHLENRIYYSEDSQEYSVSNIYELYYDEDMKDFVYNFSNVSIGDKLKVTDTIKDVSYDSSNNRTIFKFDTRFGEAIWPFDGDLTHQYSAGEEVSFIFEVVKEYQTDNYTFENLDYFQMAREKLDNADIALNIDDYIVE